MADASFVAPTVAATEVLVFRITVTDDDGATGSDTVTVTVNDIAPPPPLSRFNPLGDLPGGDAFSTATGVSDDGSVVVGLSGSAAGTEAFRWTAGTGIVGLGDLAGGGFGSQAHGVSADGSVVVGNSDSASGPEAVLWTSAGGMMGLGDLPGGIFESRARSVSADGSTVVGESESASGKTAFVWTQSDGMQSLRDVLIANGVTGLDNWELREATSISADGEWVVGDGINPSGDREAFLASVSAP